MGALLRPDRLQVFWSGPGLLELPGLVSGEGSDAAVCAIINLHLLTGASGAAVSACWLRMRDWLGEGERDRGPWVRVVRATSLSHRSHNIS